MCSCILPPPDVLLQALVDGPTEITGVVRQVVPFKRVALTDLKVKIPRNARAKTLKKAWEVRPLDRIMITISR